MADIEDEERESVLEEIEHNIKELEELKRVYDELKNQPDVVISEELQRFMEG